jgi:hypothetical protein
MHKYFYTLLFLFLANISFSQSAEDYQLTPEMKEMLVGLTKSFFEPAEKHEEDNVYNRIPFNIVNGELTDEYVNSILQNFKSSLHIDSSISSYSYSDSEGNEFDFIKADVLGQYAGIPQMFRTGDPIINGLMACDDKGKSLMRSKADLLKFHTYKGYPYASIDQYGGKFEEVLMLKEVPVSPVTVRGTMIFTYPTHITAIEFTKADIGKTKELNGKKGTLVSMDNGQSLIKWDSGQLDEFNMACLNKDGYRFNGYSSSTTDPWLYQQILERNALNDSVQMKAIFNEYKPLYDMNSPRMAKYTVYGELHKIIFYVASAEMKEKAIDVELKSTFR